MRHVICMLGLVTVILASLSAFMAGSASAAGRETESRSPGSGMTGREASPPDRRAAPVTPESHVPPRSPDLGQSFSPLTPSIGPGSRSLGPEAGREPAHPRPEVGAGSGDSRSRR